MAKEIKVQNHVLVPKQRVLTKEEADKLFARYNVSSKQMPHISLKDPSLENLEVEVGDIIEILRDSETEVEAIFYRRVKK